MAGSLLLGGLVELLGKVPSQLPGAEGAVYTLAGGEYGFGTPQPVVDVTGQLLGDGERPYGRRFSNRTVTLPVVIQAPDLVTLAGAREVLLQIVDQDTWNLRYSRDTTAGAAGIVFECFRAGPSAVTYSLTDYGALICRVGLSFAALPFGRSETVQTLSFASPASGYSAPPPAVAIDDFTTVSSTTQPSYWARSSTAAAGASYSAFWNRSATPGDICPFYTHTVTAKDITGRAKLTFWLGLACDDDGGYAEFRNGPRLPFVFTLTDSAGRKLSFGTRVGCYASQKGAPAPRWNQITAAIPQNAAGFDYAHVTGYSIKVWRFLLADGDQELDCDAYLCSVATSPGTTGAPATTRGTVYQLRGILGSARTPLSLLFQQSGLAAYRTLIAHRPGLDAPRALVPIVNVGNGTSTVPDGSENTVPAYAAGISARYAGTYTVVVSANVWNTPANARTVTVAFKQYDYPGGPSASVSVSKSFTPNSPGQGEGNGLCVVGNCTLPVKYTAPDNTDSCWTIAVTSGNTSDRLMDVVLLDTEGQTVLVNVPAAQAGYTSYWVDEPTASADLGRVLGSNTDRSRAVSVLGSAIVTGGPLTAEPGDNALLCYSVEGQPALTASYYDRYWADLPS